MPQGNPYRDNRSSAGVPTRSGQPAVSYTYVTASVAERPGDWDARRRRLLPLRGQRRGQDDQDSGTAGYGLEVPCLTGGGPFRTAPRRVSRSSSSRKVISLAWRTS